MKLSPNLLLSAYQQGIFPMADDDGEIHWYRPDPRTIIPLDRFHCSRRLLRTMRQGRFEIRINYDFQGVMELCALPALGRETTWINEEIVASYVGLHKRGYAHSVESWYDGVLVGGLYGVGVKGLFAGESMFHQMRDASKVALVALVEHLRARGFYLLDTQFMTDHLKGFGAIEIPVQRYEKLLQVALQQDVSFT